MKTPFKLNNVAMSIFASNVRAKRSSGHELGYALLSSYKRRLYR